MLVLTALTGLALADPSGTYQGSKTIVGETFTVTNTFDKAGHVDLQFTGAVSVDCVEDYTYANGKISLTNLDKPGDCAHDSLSGKHATLTSVTYDEDADEITLNVKYLFLSESLTLKKVMELSETGPVGIFKGYDDPLGVKTEISMTFKPSSNDAASFDLTITLKELKLSIKCPAEAYTWTGILIDATDKNKVGDCIHDDFAALNGKLETIKFNAFNQVIKFVVKDPVFKVVLTLQKEGVDIAEDKLSIDNSSSASISPMRQLVKMIEAEVQAGPDGAYAGVEKALGQQTNVTMAFDADAATMAFEIHGPGPLKIDCPNEPFTVEGNVVKLTNEGTDEDCVHKELLEKDIMLVIIKYIENDSLRAVFKHSNVIRVVVNLQKVENVAPFKTVRNPRLPKPLGFQ